MLLLLLVVVVVVVVVLVLLLLLLRAAGGGGRREREGAEGGMCERKGKKGRGKGKEEKRKETAQRREGNVLPHRVDPVEKATGGRRPKPWTPSDSSHSPQVRGF